MSKKNLILSITMGVFLTLTIIYYFYHYRDKTIITLAPSDGAIKVRPKDRGGFVVPHANSLVYNKLNDKNVAEEKVYILPAPEKPISIHHPSTAKIQTKIFNSIDSLLENIESYEDELLEDATNNKENADYALPNSLTKNKNLYDINKNSNPPSNNMIFVDGTNLILSKASKDRYKITNSNLISTNKNSKGYKIQLSSADSLIEANKIWDDIKNKHSQILQNSHPIIKKSKARMNVYSI